MPRPPRSPHAWSPVPVRLPPPLRAALAVLLARDGWSLAGLVRHLLVQHLVSQGLWPPL